MHNLACERFQHWAAQVQDIDREGLVEHFAIKSEAKTLREWVAKSDSPRPEGFEARMVLAKKRREEGNKACVVEMIIW